MNVLVLGANGLFGGKTVIRLLQDPKVECVVSMVHESPVKDWVMKSIVENKKNFTRSEEIYPNSKTFLTR